MNSLLPSPRELSNSLAENKYYVDARRTMAVGIWALFIGYDMSHTAVSLAGKANKTVDRLHGKIRNRVRTPRGHE